MTRWSITIAQMIGIVLACGLGLAAIRSPTPMGSPLIFTAMAASICGAVVASGIRRKGGFWFGYAVFALGFQFLVLVASFDDPSDARPDDLFWRRLFPVIHPEIYEHKKQLAKDTMSGQGEDFPTYEESEFYLPFRHVLRCLCCMVFGVGGGLFARFLESRRPADRAVSLGTPSP